MEYPPFEPSPLTEDYRRSVEFNPAASINYTAFIPPVITDTQYIIEDGKIGVAIQSVQVLDAIATGRILVLGTGRLVIL